MKRLLLVSMISLFSASVYGMNTTNALSLRHQGILSLQKQLQRCNQNNNQKTDYALAQRVTGIQTLDLHKTTIVKFVPTITRPQHNHPATLGEKHLISMDHAGTIKAMSGNTITIKPLVKKQTTPSLPVVLTTQTEPKLNHLATPRTKHLLILPGNATTVAAMSNNTIAVKPLIKKQARRSLAVLTTPLKQLPRKQLPTPTITITISSNQQTKKFTPNTQFLWATPTPKTRKK
jgi:hypothetical protein